LRPLPASTVFPSTTLFRSWLVQRVWMAVLLCAAFLGTVKLAEALGIGTLHTRIVAGVAYALAPRVLTLISYNSAELQPMMLLPLIVLPLVHGADRKSTRLNSSHVKI